MDKTVRQKLAIQRRKMAAELATKHGWVCWYCSSPLKPSGQWELDHIVPKSRGGKAVLSNLALACIHCNRAKLNFDLKTFAQWLYKPKKVVSTLEDLIKVPQGQLNYIEDLQKGLRRVG